MILKKRLTIVFSFFVFLFLLVISKALYIQVINNDKLLAYSESQLIREYKEYPNRGNIVDRNNNPLAINIKTYNIFTLPKLLKGNRRGYKKLSRIVPHITYRKIIAKVKGRDRYTWLARKVKLTNTQVAEIKKLDGIFLEAQYSRFYPNKDLLSQTIGFVGIDNDGLGGVEYQFNEKLRGEVKIVKYLKDAKGRPIKRESIDFHNKASDLQLSIDKDIQAATEKFLKEAVIEHKALKGGVGVLDAKTGEILAVANYPSFDPNSVGKSKPEHRRLSFVTDPFEPGSIFKIITVASALENKIVTEETHYYCERGRFLVGDHYIKEAEAKKKFEWLSVSDIIKHSSNIGTTKIAFDLKYPKLRETIKKFNIGERTGIEIPGESRGIFTKKENISPLSLSNISFGQGIATTGIQMLSTYAVIANSGVYMNPTLIKGGNKDSLGERVLSKEVASKLEKMLVTTVEEGTGMSARIPYFTIAGKTSTAQKAIDSKYDGSYISGFIGYPTNVKNRFVIYAYIDEPNAGKFYGSAVAAPLFKKVARHILFKDKHFGDLAINKKSKEKMEVDSVRWVQGKSRYFGERIVPEFGGLDKLSARKLAKRVGLLLENRGAGVSSYQSLKAGVGFSPGQKIIIRYSPPVYE
ncbi:MAG: penicillin-binding protein 2 [Bacteriovoracaceae bacterium]|jgi:cell division protein FtsI (penicillin-binding protein 3)|nr:penicillin-binding protein 2 [Bacteriovoracaceae bacterium]